LRQGSAQLRAELHSEQAVQENNLTRTRQASVSAALAAVRAEGSPAVASSVRFPAEDGGRSLAEVAQRDLDSALQLLADRAQYITGASGAAIALRRIGKNDMLCRASTGSTAPELGALLSTEFGLSGESVRTRQALRCDDAERDVRVNRDVCRQMGIASVVVMPVVNDDEVLGVFELFSGKANAFGARDVSAVQRLSEMVETAVRLARATENLSDRLKMPATSALEVQEAEVLEDQVLEGQVLEDIVVEASGLEESVLEEREPVQVEVAETAQKLESLETGTARVIEAPANPESDVPANHEAAAVKPTEVKIPASSQEKAETVSPAPSAEAQPKKKLFWSVAANPVGDAGKREEADQSHVPPVLRGLRKCDACGFPVSAGRALCVECEEKKWRGHLKVVSKVVARQAEPAASPIAEKLEPVRSGAEILTKENSSIAELEAQRNMKPGPSATAPVISAAAVAVAAPKAEARAFAAAAQSAPAIAPIPSTFAGSSGAVAESPGKGPKAAEGQTVTAVPASIAPVRETADAPEERISEITSPEFVLSAGLAPSQSWLSRNKYILGTLVLAGVVVVAIFLLR
jgi:GAF domain-containing protein